jgi:hypothetical protein
MLRNEIDKKQLIKESIKTQRQRMILKKINYKSQAKKKQRPSLRAWVPSMPKTKISKKISKNIKKAICVA